MPMRAIVSVLLFGWLWAPSLLAAEPALSPCLMQPRVQAMVLPERGFSRLPGDDLDCPEVPLTAWQRAAAGPWTLAVHADGPAGSGRFWTLAVGVLGDGPSPFARGVCLSSSTIGWRTLQGFGTGALRWLEDVDGDGNAELILWDSFALRDEPSMAEYGLMAWVYRLAAADTLRLDRALSRSRARTLATAYRLASVTPAHLEALRSEAATALEEFADGRCAIVTTALR